MPGDDSGANGDWITNKLRTFHYLNSDRFATARTIDGKTTVTIMDDGNWNLESLLNKSDKCLVRLLVERMILQKNHNERDQLTIDSYDPNCYVTRNDSADLALKAIWITQN